MSFIEELKRRNVFRVGIAYVLLGWVVLQAADFALDLIDAPNWVIQVFFIAGLIGLPFALFFAWAFELTPEGIKREEDVDRSASVTPATGRKLDKAIIAFLTLALLLVLGERFFLAPDRVAPPQAPASQVSADRAQPPAKTVAVLPFADMSQAQDQAWFADGLAEEILNSLVRVPDLQVASRTSSFQYRDTALSIQQVGEELGVAHVLEGSVRSAGDRIRVTAQLIRAEDGFHLFSETYDRDLEDMIGIQEDLARAIATALETSLDPEALDAMAQVGTQSISAYQAYLRGLQLRQVQGASMGDRAAAYEQFEEARRLDPGFFSAHLEAAEYWKVELGNVRTNSGSSDLTSQGRLVAYKERIQAANRTARSEVDRLRVLADQSEVDVRLREALDLYERYLEARPNDDTARFSAVTVALMLRERDKARALSSAWIERGLDDFTASIALVNVAYLYGSPSEAADLVERVLVRFPNNSILMYQAHRTLLWANRRLEARSVADRYRGLVETPAPLLELRQQCAEGDREGAEATLTTVESNDTNALVLMNNLLGNQEEIVRVLTATDTAGVPFTLAANLIYRQFDPRPYPGLMAVLEREGVTDVEPEEPPFKCPPPERTSVAVLAFENMSPDPENEYFADGIAEEILNVLSDLDDLRVIARTSAFSFKGSGATVAEIADKLDVGYVLEGSVRRAGDRVRVTAQLIETATESHLWSENYDRDLDDIFAVQDEIARAIAAELELKLSPEQEAGLVVVQTDNIEAYNQFLLGRQLWHQRGDGPLRRSVELLEGAVSADPDFAKAWAALADSYLMLMEYSFDPQERFIDKAREAANRALELQPGMPQALTTRAYLRFAYDFDWENAERDFLRAMETDPAYPTAQQWYGEYLAVRYRDIDGALEQFEKGARLDPLAPIMRHVAGWISAQAGRYEEGVGYYQQALGIDPGFVPTYLNLSDVYLHQLEFDEAQAMWERVQGIASFRSDSIDLLIAALKDPARKPDVLVRMAEDPLWPTGANGKARGYMLLGEPDLAMDELERALAEKDPYAVHANRMAVYDPLRETPRFQAHLAKMNLWPPTERP